MVSFCIKESDSLSITTHLRRLRNCRGSYCWGNFNTKFDTSKKMVFPVYRMLLLGAIKVLKLLQYKPLRCCLCNGKFLRKWCARRDSNPRHRLRRPVLYPVELRAHASHIIGKKNIEVKPTQSISWLLKQQIALILKFI